MNREVHVRFFEGLRVQLPWATHLLSFMAMRGITACDGSLPLGEQCLNLTEQEIDIHGLRQYAVRN